MPRTPHTIRRPEVFPDPRIDDVVPAAALPLGEVELIGAHLGPLAFGPPAVLVDGHSAHVLMSRPTRLALRVPKKQPPASLKSAAPPAPATPCPCASPASSVKACIPSPAPPSAAPA
jgi:hypothetical protein